MAYKALDIANKIISKTDVERGDTISNLKLQKLLYYVQGFNLAVFDKPLFDEDIQAWPYGPVVPEVFNAFKKHRKGPINPQKYPDTLTLTKEEQDLFDKVYAEYSQYSAIGLMNLTHDEGPWKNHGIGEVIPKEELKDFFKTQIA